MIAELVVGNIWGFIVIIYDGYLDHYIFVNLKFDLNEKQYDNFIGRIKTIDGYENVPIRYRRLIESDNWDYL